MPWAGDQMAAHVRDLMNFLKEHQHWLNQASLYSHKQMVAGLRRALLSFIVAFISISFKSIAAAKANPVDSLRSK